MKALVGHPVEYVSTPEHVRVIQNEHHMFVIVVANRNDTVIAANGLLEIDQFTIIQAFIDMNGNITDSCTHDTPPDPMGTYLTPLY